MLDDEQLRRSKTIMISSAAGSSDSQRCRELGIARYMTKPVVQSELLDTILHVMLAGEDFATTTTAGIESSGVRLRILLVEDEYVNQRVAVGLLERMGHDVQIAENGKLAIDAWRRSDFDVILVDWQMPVMDGKEATNLIRAEESGSEKHTIVVAMSAAAMKGDREKCSEAGKDDYVSKPIDPQTLADTLQKYAPADRPELQQAIQQQTIESEQSDSSRTQRVVDSKLGNGQSEMYELIDVEYARSRLGGCADALLFQIAEILMAESVQRIGEIEAGLQQQDSALVTRGVHTLKGAASNFKATELVAVAETIEKLSRSDKLDSVTEKLDTLKKHAAQLNRELSAFLATKEPH